MGFYVARRALSDSSSDYKKGLHRGHASGLPGVDIHLIAGNILYGVTIFGILGTATQWVYDLFANTQKPAILHPSVPNLEMEALENHSGGEFAEAHALTVPELPTLVLENIEDHSGGTFTEDPTALAVPEISLAHYATLIYESYLSGGDGDSQIYGDNWIAQTFTPQANHNLNIIWLKLKKSNGTALGTLNIGLKATDGAGKPTGADIQTAAINADEVLSNAYRNVVFLITSQAVVNGTKYALVLSLPTGDAADYVAWQHDGSSPAYTRGVKLASTDGGSTWTEASNVDLLFEEGEYTT